MRKKSFTPRTIIYSLLLAGFLALAGISYLNQNASANVNLKIFLPLVAAQSEGGTIPSPN